MTGAGPDGSGAEGTPGGGSGAGAAPGIADLVLRVAGGAVATAAGLVTAVWALYLVPLRVDTWVGQVRLPVAVLLATAGNLLLIRFARNVTGIRWGAVLPGVSWFAVIVLSLEATSEGDRLLVPNDWVATLTIFGGVVTIVVGTALAFVDRSTMT